MIERLNKKGTIRLLVAIKNLAESDVKRYGTHGAASTRGSAYVSSNSYKSARLYLEEELPVIREVLGDSFKENPQWQELTIKNT